MPQSKFFRVATEGATTDGRTIERSWIVQMAKNYDAKKKLGARINLEHIRGIMPDGPFKAYGDVLAAESRAVEDGKLALFVSIDPTNELLALNKNRQKIYTSVEIDPNFAKSGEAYLVGLAVTDNPASLGNEMLSFNATQAINPYATRKQSPDNLFSSAIELSLEIDEEKSVDEFGLLYRVKQLLTGEKDTRQNHAARIDDQGKAIEAIAHSQAELLKRFSLIAPNESAQQTEKLSVLKAAHDALLESFTELVKTLEATPANKAIRPRATGGNGEAATDC